MSRQVRPSFTIVVVIVCLAAAGMLLTRASTRVQAHQPQASVRAQAMVDHGDPLIRDERVDAKDRGHYPYQDIVCGAGCGSVAIRLSRDA